MCYGAQLSVLTLLPTMFMKLGHTYANSLIDTSLTQTGSVAGAVLASLLARFIPRKRMLTVGALCAALSAGSILCVVQNIAAVMICAIIFQLFALLLNTSIWIYAPELYPTRTRAFGVAVILAAGSAAGAIMPTIAGSLFDHYDLTAVLALVAAMYAVCAATIQFCPETFGQSMEHTMSSSLDDKTVVQEAL